LSVFNAERARGNGWQLATGDWQLADGDGERRRTANPDVKSGLSLRSSDKERPILK